MARTPLQAVQHERLDRLPGVILALCAALLTASVLMCVLALVIYDERAAADSRRFPMAVQEQGESTVSVLIDPDHLSDNQSHWVVYLSPDGPDAPLPPGLSRWPAPGEAALSPELRRVMVELEGADDRYGTVVASIGPIGLGAPDERLAYVGADLAGASGAHPYGGWGTPGPISGWDVGSSGAYFGESLNVSDLRWPVLMLILLAVVPSVLAVGVATSYIRHRRARRDLVLSALGAGARLRRVLQVRASLLPVLLGSACAVLVIAWPVVLGARVPVTGFLLQPTLVTGHVPWFVLGIVVSVGLCFTLLCRLPSVSSVGNRPAQVVQEDKLWWWVAGPVAAAVAVRGPDIVDPGMGWAWAITYWVGALGTLALMPLTLARLVTALASGLHVLARRRGDATALVAFAWLARSPRTTLRACVGLMVLIGVMFQAVSATQGTSEDLRRALQTQEVVGDRLLTVRAYDRIDAEHILAAAPQTALVLVEPDRERFTLRLTGDCDDLRVLLATSMCPGRVATGPDTPGHLVSMIDYTGAHQGFELIDTDVTSLSQDAATWWFRSDGQPMDYQKARRQVTRDLAPHADVERPGESWVAGASDAAHEGLWIPVFAVVGLTATMLALVVDLHGRIREYAARVGVLSTLVGRQRDLWIVAGYVTVLPFTLIGALAFVLNALIVQPVTTTVPPSPSVIEALLPTIAAGIFGAVVVGWVTIGASSVRQARRWVARGEETD